jgi:DNA-binding NtrC family response regulator
MFYPSKTKKTVFIVDMEHNTRELIRRWMLDEGFRAESFQDVSSCLMEMQRTRPDVLLLDMLTASIAGFDALARIREIDDTIPTVLLYHDRLMETALQAIREGAFDFHPKPVERFRLSVSVKNAAERRILELENDMLRRDLERHKSTPPAPNKEGLSIRDVEKQAIRNALVASKGNVSKAARVLGLGRTTLYRKMSSYGIEDSKRSAMHEDMAAV